MRACRMQVGSALRLRLREEPVAAFEVRVRVRRQVPGSQSQDCDCVHVEPLLEELLVVKRLQQLVPSAPILLWPLQLCELSLLLFLLNLGGERLQVILEVMNLLRVLE